MTNHHAAPSLPTTNNKIIINGAAAAPVLDGLDPALLDGVHGGTLLHAAGEAVGFGAGVAVTGALSAVPSWSQQVPGQPEGFQKRHEAVVGPKVTSYANGQAPGPWKDFTSGVGAGATAAPGWAFRHGM